jgi:hypothetical protein
MPVNFAALLQSLKAQQPPLNGPVMGGAPPDGALGGPADFRNPYMTRPAPQQDVRAAIADAIRSATGWQPGTPPLLFRREVRQLFCEFLRALLSSRRKVTRMICTLQNPLPRSISRLWVQMAGNR